MNYQYLNSRYNDNRRPLPHRPPSVSRKFLTDPEPLSLFRSLAELDIECQLPWTGGDLSEGLVILITFICNIYGSHRLSRHTCNPTALQPRGGPTQPAYPVVLLESTTCTAHSRKSILLENPGRTLLSLKIDQMIKSTPRCQFVGELRV